MVKGQLKILCICGCLLGNKTVTAVIKETLESLQDLQIEYVFIESQDYSNYPVPKWKKSIGMTTEILHIIRQKIKHVDFSQYDMVIVQGFEIGWAVNKHVENMPCVMFNDTNHVASHELLFKCQHTRLFKKLRSLVLMYFYKAFYRNVFSNIDRVYPQTDWCGQSMIKVFGVAKEKVSGCTIATDLTKWNPKVEYKNTGKMNLLFVGNDFQRKGGKFLLELFPRILDKANLTIVSNDSFFQSANLAGGINHLKNITHSELSRIYQDTDIFLFPTYLEQFGMVQIEALASGLPLISRDVGGVSDAVIDGYNGFLMPYNSSEDQWVEKIQYLINHPEERERMGRNSRKLAEEKFSMEKFSGVIRSAIKELVE